MEPTISSYNCTYNWQFSKKTTHFRQEELFRLQPQNCELKLERKITFENLGFLICFPYFIKITIKSFFISASLLFLFSENPPYKPSRRRLTFLNKVYCLNYTTQVWISPLLLFEKHCLEYYLQLSLFAKTSNTKMSKPFTLTSVQKWFHATTALKKSFLITDVCVCHKTPDLVTWNCKATIVGGRVNLSQVSSFSYKNWLTYV